MAMTNFVFKSGAVHHLAYGNAYFSSRFGSRFVCTHQTPGTGITGQTSYVATTPTFIIYQAASATRLILSNMTLSQAGTAAGGVIDIAVVIDTANRYASGGTAVVPQNTNTGDTSASNATFKTTATASAAGSGTRVVTALTTLVNVGASTSIDFQDEILIDATGSILVYTWAATTAPTWRFDFEWFEENLS